MKTLKRLLKNIFHPDWRGDAWIKYKHEQEQIVVDPPYSEIYEGWNGEVYEYCSCDRPTNNYLGMAYCSSCDKRIPPELCIINPDDDEHHNKCVSPGSVIGVYKKRV